VPFCEINANDLAKHRLEAGDIVISRMGTVGLSSIVEPPQDAVAASYLVRFRLRDEAVYPPFVAYVLRSPLWWSYVDSRRTGSVQPNLNAQLMSNFRFPIPALADQRAIAGELGALDDKIKSDRRLVRDIEQLGRAELAYALSGRDGESWEYAWPEVQLGDALSLIETGDRPKGGVGEIATGVPSVGAESIVAPGVFDFSKTKFVPEEYFARMRRGVLQSGDVLLYKDGGTPGNFIPKVSMCQDGFPFEVAALNSHVYRLRIEAPYSQAFLYFWLSSQRLLDEMWLRGTGAAIPSLNSTNVKGLPFPMVPASRLAPVLPIVDELMARLHKAAKEQRTLEQLRDALLPELLSGRLRVREAEEMVGSV